MLASGIERTRDGSWVDLDEPAPRTAYPTLDEAQRARSARLGPECWEYAWFKRSNGHQATSASAMPLAMSILGLNRPNRYVLRKRAIYRGEWEDA